MLFGLDHKLYLSTGENANGPNAQDTGNLLGKLLRINKDGRPADGYPHYDRRRP
jgi:glucose/arabinose dehydrogenase